MVTGVSRDHPHPRTLLEAAHKEPAVDGSRLPFVVHAVEKISGEVLASAMKVCERSCFASGVLVQGSFFRCKALMKFSMR